MIRGLTFPARLPAIGPLQCVFASFVCSSLALLAFLTGTVEAHLTGRALPSFSIAAAGPCLSRAELLAFMWGDPFTGTGILAGALLLLLLALAGAIGVIKLQRPVAAAISSFVFCAGLAGGWALLTPPLQAPDEADQFLGFLEMRDFDPVARPDALVWANRMHFERIKFRRAEGFNGAYIAEPLSGRWGWHIAPVDVQSRSPLTFRVWRALAVEFSASGFSVGARLLLLRFANVLALSAAFALSSFALAGLGNRINPGKGSAQSAAFMASLMLIPTFCFFSVHVSNYGSLMSGLVVLFAGLCLTVQRTPWRPLEETGIGLLIGGGLAVSMFSTRSAIPIASLLVFLLIARNLFERLTLKRTAAFWLATGMAFLAGTQLPDTHYQDSAMFAIREVLVNLGAPDAAPSFLQAQGVLAVLLLVFFALEVAVQRVHAMFDRQRLAERNLRAVYVLAAAILACILVAANISPGHLANNEIGTPLRGFDYVRPVVIRFLDQLFPISTPDFLLSTSFWGGFGWLDRLLPGTLVFFIKMIPLAALIAYGFVAARNPEDRPAFLKMAVFFLAAISLVSVNACLTTGLDHVANLHGRYLIIPYLLLLLPAMSVLMNESRRRTSLPGYLVAGLLILHTILWCWLLNGYLF